MESTIDPAVRHETEAMCTEASVHETVASVSAKPERKHPFWMKQHSKKILYIIFPVLIFLLICIILPVCIVRKTSEQSCPDINPFVPLGPACPAGWVGYERKCYFFSNEERNWTFGQSFCASHNSSLAVIKHEPEKAFVLRYKGIAGHWIGLEKNLSRTWKWADGEELDNTLEVKGEGGDCAFLSSGYAISSQCHIARYWICSHPDIYTGPTLLYTDISIHRFD